MSNVAHKQADYLSAIATNRQFPPKKKAVASDLSPDLAAPRLWFSMQMRRWRYRSQHVYKFKPDVYFVFITVDKSL